MLTIDRQHLTTANATRLLVTELTIAIIALGQVVYFMACLSYALGREFGDVLNAFVDKCQALPAMRALVGRSAIAFLCAKPVRHIDVIVNGTIVTPAPLPTTKTTKTRQSRKSDPLQTTAKTNEKTRKSRKSTLAELIEVEGRNFSTSS